jgi:hypothetical protein
MRTGDYVNDKPVYRSGENYELRWMKEPEGHWEFKDPSRKLGVMISNNNNFIDASLYPTSYQNWTYLNYTRTSEISGTVHASLFNSTRDYLAVKVICKYTPTPTRAPSHGKELFFFVSCVVFSKSKSQN